MPLKQGKGTIRTNIKELMSDVQSPARSKAIKTIMKKRGVSQNEAQFIQAKAIALSQVKK